MHFYALVAIPPGHDGDVIEAVEQLMAPWCEYEGDNDAGFWDWYQIGGRWTGHLSDYDPCAGDVQRWGDVRGLVLASKTPHTALVGEAVAHVERYIDDETAKYGYRREDTSAEVTALLKSLSDDARVVIVDYHS